MQQYFLGVRLFQLWKKEFQGYSFDKFRRDLLAGVTVAAVALPLALAFGVASGATAAAGLVTAIVAGTAASILGGAPFQITGPTGAMSAVVVVIASRYGLEGVWLASVMAGVIIILLGLFKMGQIINFIPSAVITGFTSGIAIIIFVGQIGNLLGVETIRGSNSFAQLWGYIQAHPTPNLAAVFLSLLVIATMIVWPKHLNARFPGSLLGLILATVVSVVFRLDVPTIGTIPQSILLDQRLRLSEIPWHHLLEMIGPAMSVAALGAIKSLLCGAVIGRQAGVKMDDIQELFAQGVGNILVPFFGGVPGCGAIARGSVVVKSGAVTRLAGILHGLVLLSVVFAVGPVISHVPLAALGGVLAVTAWRTNDWAAIRDIFRHRFPSELPVFLFTMIATAAFDLTQAIFMGVAFSALIFVFQSSQTEIVYKPISVEAMRKMGYEMQSNGDRILVVYIVGPLFFGTVHRFTTVMEKLNAYDDIILSLRTVPLIDTTGLRVISEFIQRHEAAGRHVYLSGLARPVREKLERGGVIAMLGEDRIFWSADQAIIAADRRRAEKLGLVQSTALVEATA